jgi:hypothetical protein
LALNGEEVSSTFGIRMSLPGTVNYPQQLLGYAICEINRDGLAEWRALIWFDPERKPLINSRIPDNSLPARK